MRVKATKWYFSEYYIHLLSKCNICVVNNFSIHIAVIWHIYICSRLDSINAKQQNPAQHLLTTLYYFFALRALIRHSFYSSYSSSPFFSSFVNLMIFILVEASLVHFSLREYVFVYVCMLTILFIHRIHVLNCSGFVETNTSLQH